MKTSLAPIAPDALVRAEKSLLGGIVGERSISTAQPQEETANGALVFSHQRRKGVAVVVSDDARDEWSALHPSPSGSLALRKPPDDQAGGADEWAGIRPAAQLPLAKP